MPFGSFKGYTVRKNRYLPPKSKKVEKAVASTETKPLNPVQLKQVKKQIGKEIEHKHFDREQTYTGVGLATPYQLQLTTIPIPANPPVAAQVDQTRQGDEVTLKSMKIRLSFVNQPNGTSSLNANASTLWRVVVLQDKSFNTTGLFTLSGAYQTFNGTYNQLSQRNMDRKNDITVLYDKVHRSEEVFGVEKYIDVIPNMKYCKKRIEYTAGGNSHSNAIYLLIWNDSIAVATLPSVAYSSRLIFTDA